VNSLTAVARQASASCTHKDSAMPLVRTDLSSAADQINKVHLLARSCAETAVEYAIECGRMLLAVKRELPHGQFQSWIEEHCSFGYSTAHLYITAAKRNAKGIAFNSLRGFFPSSRAPTKQPAAKRQETENDTQVIDRKEISNALEISAPQQSAADDAPDLSEFVDAAEELAQVESDFRERMERVLAADDRMAQMADELKRASQEIVALKQARDRYMNECAAMRRMLKAKDREIARLRKQAA